MKPLTTAILLVLLGASFDASAHEIKSPVNQATDRAFDVLNASVTTDGRVTKFMLDVAGLAGSVVPAATGALKGAKVGAYVWPTDLDPQVVGFAPKSGILALSVTAHPDFDDTPLYDENGDGDKANDGKAWHSHWVVLEKDAACAAGLKVRDIAPGKDMLPATAPGLPLAIDSPSAMPSLSAGKLELAMPLEKAEGASFDGVTAELKVNEAGAAPLLCVTKVHDIASGDLSLTGKITRQ